MSPVICTFPDMKPNNSSSFGSTATTLASGVPRFVTNTGSPVACTCFIMDKHFDLNFPTAIFFIGTPHSQSVRDHGHYIMTIEWLWSAQTQSQTPQFQNCTCVPQPRVTVESGAMATDTKIRIRQAALSGSPLPSQTPPPCRAHPRLQISRCSSLAYSRDERNQGKNTDLLIHGSAIKNRANLRFFNHLRNSNRRLKGGLRNEKISQFQASGRNAPSANSNSTRKIQSK